MKILLVAHHVPPRHVAGTEVYTLRLARCLSDRHEVTVFATDDDPGLEPGEVRRRREDAYGVVEIGEPRMVRRASESWSSPRAESAFASILAELRPDVCHFQHLRFLSLALPGIARRAGVPTVMTLHDYWLLCPRDGQLVDRADRRCDGPGPEKCADCVVGYRFGLSPGELRARKLVASLRRWTGVDLSPAARRIGLAVRGFSRKPFAGNVLPQGNRTGMLPLIEARRAAAAAVQSSIDVFIAPSKFLRAVFRDAGFAGGRWEIVGHGVDRARSSEPAPVARGIGPLRIGFAGVLAPLKGVDILIRAVSSLPDDSYVLDVHGRDDARPEYARRLRRAAAGRPVRFHGAFEPGSEARFMVDWDVAAVPSRWVENQPLTLLEARASGVPVVASDLGGMRELVEDGVDGRLFEADSSESLARVLLDLVRRPEEVARLRAGVRRPPSMQSHAARIESVYDLAIATR